MEVGVGEVGSENGGRERERGGREIKTDGD